MNNSLNKNYQFLAEIIVINLTFLFFLLRGAIPFFKYPFIALYLSLIVFSVIKYRGELITSFMDFLKNYYLIIILFLIFVAAFLLSKKIYQTIFKDILNITILISIAYLLSLYVRTKKVLSTFHDYLINIIILFALVISVVWLGNLFNIFTGEGASILLQTASDKSPVVFEIDNNFGILPVIFGLIAILLFLIKDNSFSNKYIYNFLLVLFAVSIFLSGSRRGLILLLIIIFLILSVYILSFIVRKDILKTIRTRTFFFICTLILLAISSWYFIFFTSNSFKNNTLRFIGSKNLLHTKQNIVGKLIKYTSVVNEAYAFSDIYNIIWTPVFNPKDPESSWGTRTHKTVFPLTGKDAEIVPGDAIGYLMDKNCNPSYYPESNLCESYSPVANLKVNSGDHYKASVYCFVSEDFDGSTVSFGISSVAVESKTAYGKTNDYFNLGTKGKWKKLDIDFTCNQGEVPILLSFTATGVKSFSNLKGYVIFAYPNYEIVRNDKNTKTDSVISAAGFNTEKNFLNPEIHIHSNRYNLEKSSLIPNPFSVFKLLHIIPQEDPVRNWVSKFVSEDTTYYGYKNKLQEAVGTNEYTGDERIVRWQFAWQIFSKEYNWSKKIFGGGFDHLNWFGYYFYNDKTKSEWPHNPFLSVLLYSGILGLIIYCFMLYKVFYYYLKYVRVYPLLFVFFIITFFFSFFSGGSPFDPPIMGFFVILPFFLHSVHKKDKPEMIKN